METYQQLQGVLANLLVRRDYNVRNPVTNDTDNMLDIWLQRAQRRAYDGDITRLPPFEEVSDATVEVGVNYVNIPAGYNEAIRLIATVDDTDIPLSRTSPDVIIGGAQRNSKRNVFAYSDRKLIFPAVSQETKITVHYYTTLDNINTITENNTIVTDDNRTIIRPHWLLNDAGEWLVYEAALEAVAHFRIPNVADLYLQRRNEISRSIIGRFTNQEASGTKSVSHTRYR